MINTINTRIDTARALPIALNFRHGETVLISIALYNQGQPLKLNEEVAATLFYRTNDLADNQWYKSDDSVEIDNDGNFSIVNLLWTGNLDNGADFYQYAIQLTEGTNHSYAIHGSIALENSPGFVPNEIALPIKLLDFSSVQVANAPYYTKRETNIAQEKINNTLEEHAKSIEDLRNDITGDGNESLRQHEENHNNPHKVKVEQLTEKCADAGRFKFEYSETDNHPWGYSDFDFDPAMFNRGQVYLTALYNGTPLPFDAMVHRLDLPNFGNSLIFRSDEKYYISDGEYYIDWILNNINSDDFSFGLSINPNDEFDNFADWHVLVSNDTNPVANKEYRQGGIYKVLTEAMLRDDVTGIAYTIKVSNGELHLVEYREESFEG